MTEVAGLPPIIIASELPETKFVPAIVTNWPPPVLPVFGVMLVYTGGVTYVYAPVVLTVPPFPFVILTHVDPAVPAGVTAVSEVADP